MVEEDYSFFSRGNSKKKLDIFYFYFIIIIIIFLNYFYMWNIKIRFIELLLK